MNRRNALAALIISSVFVAAAGPVQAAPGGAIVPAAWEGVWDVVEVFYQTSSDCGGTVITGTRSFRDTLCAGTEFPVYTLNQLYGEVTLSCGGEGFTTTALHMRCVGYGIYPCPGNSTVQQTLEATWTLSGDIATTVYTSTTSISSGFPGCARTTCTRKTGTRTRVSDAAAACAAVPARRHSWGKLKLLYR